MDVRVIGKSGDVIQAQASTVDMSADDEATIRLRLVHELSAIVEAGLSYVVVELGQRETLRRGTTDALANAHRELRAANGRLVIVTSSRAAIECARVCPDLLAAATTRQAFAALGIASDASPSGVVLRGTTRTRRRPERLSSISGR
jgi:hypothetical protein